MSKTTLSSKVVSYRQILGLLWKYGNRAALERIGLSKHIDEDEHEDQPMAGEEGRPRSRASRFARDLEKLGPTYVKIGQILSAQADLLPQEFVDALSRLQDDVEPFPFEQVAQIIEHELGMPIREAYAHIDTTPLAAASIGQVHRATTHAGSEVAVKIQRPQAKESIERDIASLIKAADIFDSLSDHQYLTGEMLRNAKTMLEQELDYEMEADNFITLFRNLKDYEYIDVPWVLRQYSSARVLTMSYLEGKPVTALSPRELEQVDGPMLAEHMFHAYLDQMMVDGIFHADPHPGNILMQPNGRLAMLDLGSVGRVDPHLREQLIQLLLAICEGQGEQAAEIALSIGTAKERDFDGSGFREQISHAVLVHYNASRERLKIGQVVMQIAQICGEYKIAVPQTMTMIGKALVNLDQLGEVLAPQFNPRESVQKRLTYLMQRTLLKGLSPLNMADTLLELKNILKVAPHRINALLETLARKDHGFKIDAIDEDRLIHGFEKIANRITYGLIVAALFIAAAMVMNIENAGPELFQVPWLSWLMLVAAAIGTIWVVSATWFDR